MGIAHPHVETLEYLAANLGKLAAEGVSLVKISDVLSTSSELASVQNSQASEPAL
ncbi:hypothetical protein RS130_22330 [Paraglaciecola aquimarina]|uniref:Uncharacterized protein n=1 Tax=Paraglaciecola aquimarina TaxID=1235557 RepID=A0ABU3T1W1_9ALTE|nr:hypothetical protein [Paraglaciecola aquimarina]MDU0356254.1 hypothetical protein [Paraglaciecola aquimarina]